MANDMFEYILLQGDCLELFKTIPDNSVDMILCDPPYGTMTSIGNSELSKAEGYKDHSWDIAIDPKVLFQECKRILKSNRPLILFSQEPYTSKLIQGSIYGLDFAQRAVWNKKNFGNHLLAKKALCNYHEDICIFYRKDRSQEEFCDKYNRNLRDYAKIVRDYIFETFNKQNISEVIRDFRDNNHKHSYNLKHSLGVETFQFSLFTNENYDALIKLYKIDQQQWFKTHEELKKIDEQNKKDENSYKTYKIFNLNGAKHKSSIFEYKKDSGSLHPTQKPVALLEDLIRTYSNEEATVLDFTMGSGSTGVACLNTNRKFIGFELDQKFFDTAKKRISDAVSEKKKLDDKK